MIKESLFAEFEREQKIDQLGDILVSINQLIDFKQITQSVDKLLPRPSNSKGGRPPFPTELMLRILVIQHLYNLSDEKTEYQIIDRYSFIRFCGLQNSSAIPDAKTIWAFKNRFIEADLNSFLFDQISQQLDQHGYIPRNGQMIDATLIKSPVQHFTKKEKDIIKKGETPPDWSAAQKAQKDLDAQWVEKNKNQTFGYKLTTSTDVRYKLIRSIKISSAGPHDTHFLEDVITDNTSKDLYADKGYTDGKREERLKAQGMRVHIQRKKPKGKPLPKRQKQRNTRIAKVRARVEHPFAAISQMGERIVRSIGLKRVEFKLFCVSAAYNIKRLCSLVKCGIKPF